MYGLILSLAIPNIISNISVPLLSLADTAIAGRMPSLDTIGAVALATMVANFSFWLWGFLRMATTGFTAQAYGRGDQSRIRRQLCVGTLVAVLGGGFIVLVSPLLCGLGIALNDGAPSLNSYILAYLRVAYIGAPAALLLYVLNGWFVGLQNTIVPMLTTIISNILNIVLSFALVGYWGLGVEGIAWGTVMAQYAAVAIMIGIALMRYRHYLEGIGWQDFYAGKELVAYVHIAKYLLLRTMMLGSISLYFIRAGSAYGTIPLGGNTLLMQFFTIFAYFMDGFAYAGEALAGRYIGAKRWEELKQMLRILFGIGWIIAPIMSVVFYFFAEPILHLLSDKAEVLAYARDHRLWAVLVPIASFGAFLWDGIFVGATTSKPMTQAVLIAWIIFFGVYWLLGSRLGVDALWMAFVLYLGVRSLLSAYWGRKLVQRIAGEKERLI